MADVDGVLGSAVLPEGGTHKTSKVSRPWSFATTNATADDNIMLLAIPANTLVEWVALRVDTAEGGTMTFDVGDSSADDVFLDGMAGNSAATLFGDASTGATAGATMVQKFYAAANELQITPKNDADTAVVTLMAKFCDLT